MAASTSAEGGRTYANPDETDKETMRQRYIDNIKNTEINIPMEDERGKGIVSEGDGGMQYSEVCASIMKAEDDMESLKKVSQSKTDKVLKKFEQYRMDFFEPKAVSIGRNYYGRPELKFMQDLKTLIAKKFIQRNDTPMSYFCEALMLMVDDVRKFCEEKFVMDYTDDKLIDMMFLDGCFILTFMYCITWSNTEDLGMTNSQIEQVRRDLLLLGNQIPFKVLNCLKKHSKMNKHYTDSIEDFIYRSTESSFKDFDNPTHILDAARQALVGKSNVKEHVSHDGTRGPMLRNVKELPAVGIGFKSIENGTVRDISFKSFCVYGQLSLPRITIDNSTKSLFLNLIAYEMCIHKSLNDYGISSYICFLDSLIDSADDVKELRSAGILRNNLNSDEEVAQIINDMGAMLIPDNDYLRAVKAKMLRYLTSRRKLWLATSLAEVFRNHLRSPLTIFLVISAAYVIFLTSVQTYYSVFK